VTIPVPGPVLRCPLCWPVCPHCAGDAHPSSTRAPDADAPFRPAFALFAALHAAGVDPKRAVELDPDLARLLRKASPNNETAREAIRMLSAWRGRAKRVDAADHLRKCRELNHIKCSVRPVGGRSNRAKRPPSVAAVASVRTAAPAVSACTGALVNGVLHIRMTQNRYTADAFRRVSSAPPNSKRRKCGRHYGLD
jgi:hypothetical protein